MFSICTYRESLFNPPKMASVTTTFPPRDTEDYVMMRANENAADEDVTRVEVFEDGELIATLRGMGADKED